MADASDTLGLHQKDIGTAKLLTPAQERRMGVRVQAARKRYHLACLSLTHVARTWVGVLRQAQAGTLTAERVTRMAKTELLTPAQLAAFAARYGADTSRWHFVTGAPDQLKNVIGAGFRAYYTQRPDGTFTVDPVFALVDGWGILRATYRTATPDPAILQRDVRLVVQEANNSEGVNRYAYEAAHLFLCYPK